RARIEKEPDYSFVSARLLLHNLYEEAIGEKVSLRDAGAMYVNYFPKYLQLAVDAELLDPRMLEFDTRRLGAALLPERDLNFQFLGLQTLYDRYFVQNDGRRIE